MEKHRKRWTTEDEKKLVSLYNENLTFPEIAARCGRSVSACSIEIIKLREEGIYKIAPKRATASQDHPITEDEMRRFKELFAQGFKQHFQIAEKMGLSLNRVGSIARRIRCLEGRAKKVAEPEIPFAPVQKTDALTDFLRAFYDFLGQYLNQ